MQVKVILWTYDKRKDGTCPLKIRFAYQKKSQYFHLDAYIKESEWIKKERRVKGNENSQQINLKIIAIEKNCEAAILTGDPSEVRKAINLSLSGKTEEKKIQDQTPVSFFEKYIEDCRSGSVIHQKTKQPLADGYISSFETTLQRLRQFIKDKRRGSFEFSDIGPDFYSEFVSYLRNQYKQAGTTKAKGIKENSIGTSIKRFLTVFNIAAKAGYLKKEALDDFYIINVDVETIALNEAEISMIAKADLSKTPGLERERNRFFVAYNFLLRFNDSIHVDKKHIHKEDGRYFFRMLTGKTKETVYIPIMPMVYDILKRDGFKVPVISNQKSNDSLKRLGKAAGIIQDHTISEISKGKRIETVYPRYELITTHTTRRSAATNLYLSGMDLNSIRMFGGWRTIKQVMDYIKIDKLENAKRQMNHPFFNLK